MTEGPGPDRSPLVLLPGTLCNALLWRHQTWSLAEVTTPRVYDISGDDSIEALAGRVLEEAPPRFFLAGLSLGGIVAFEIMRRSPERVIALALLDTNPSPADSHQVSAWRQERLLAERGSFEELIEQRWIPSLLEAGGSRAARLRDLFRIMAHSVGPKGFVRQTLAQVGRRDSWPSLAKISCPTLVLGGRDDSMCPPALHEAMASKIPNATLALIEDCGHLSTLERPEAVTACLHEWLENARRHAEPTFSPILRESRA